MKRVSESFQDDYAHKRMKVAAPSPSQSALEVASHRLRQWCDEKGDNGASDPIELIQNCLQEMNQLTDTNLLEKCASVVSTPAFKAFQPVVKSLPTEVHQLSW